MNQEHSRIAKVEVDANLIASDQVKLEWKSVAVDGAYAADFIDAPGYTPLEFAITRHGFLVFRGACYTAAGIAMNATLFTLPEEYSPAAFRIVLSSVNRPSYSFTGTQTVKFNTDGTVTVLGISGIPSVSNVHLDAVRIPLR